MVLLLELDSDLLFVEVSRQKWPSSESSTICRRCRRRVSHFNLRAEIEPSSFEPLILRRAQTAAYC